MELCKLRDGSVESPREVLLCGKQAKNQDIERIEFNRPPNIQITFLPSQHVGKKMRVEHVCLSIVRI